MIEQTNFSFSNQFWSTMFILNNATVLMLYVDWLLMMRIDYEDYIKHIYKR